MTDDELLALEQLAARASAGPLTSGGDDEEDGPVEDGFVYDSGGYRIADCTWDVGDDQACANARFIAAARAAVPTLLAEVRRLQEHVQCLSLATDETRELDAINSGAVECAKKLAEIARVREHPGVFGGEKVEEAAQVILKAIRDAELRGVRAGLEAAAKACESEAMVWADAASIRAIDPVSVPCEGA